MLLRCNNEWMNRTTNGWMDQGGSVPLVHVAAFDWPSLPSSPLPGPAATAMIDGQVNWTPHGDWRHGSAVVQGHTSVRFGSSDIAARGHPLVTATVLAGCSDQGHNFLTAAYDHVRSLPFLADILTSCVLIRGCVLYIGLQIFTLWQKTKVGVRIIFDGVLYSKFYGKLGTFDSKPFVQNTTARCW